MSLNRLARLIAAEENPHELITQVAADSELFALVRDFNDAQKGAALKSSAELVQACLNNHIPINYFLDRLNLISRILNLTPAQDDYYAILEVSRNATQKQVKQAFRRLSLSLHPDVNPDNPNAAEDFQKVHQAYETLNDNRLKGLYDSSLVKPRWVEPKSFEEDFTYAPKKRRRIQILSFAVIIGVFLALVFFVDYQSLLTERYYRGHRQPAPKKNSMAEQTDLKKQDSLTGEVKTSPVQSLACLDRQGADCPYFTAASRAARDGGLLANPIPRLQIASLPSMKPKEEKRGGGELNNAGTTSKTSSPHQALSGKDPKPSIKNSSGKKPAPAEAKVRLAKTEVSSKASIANSASLKTEKKQDPPRRTQEDTSKLTAANKKAESLSRHLAISPSRHLPETQQLPKRLSPAPDFKSHGKAKVRFGDKVQNFLSRYRRAYEDRNLPIFMSLFEPDAQENGELVSNLREAYSQTFQNSNWIKFEFKSSRWTETGKGADVSSQFRVVLKPRGGQPVASSGTIRLDLTNHNDTFRVRTLDYSFSSVKR